MLILIRTQISQLFKKKSALFQWMREVKRYSNCWSRPSTIVFLIAIKLWLLIDHQKALMKIQILKMNKFCPNTEWRKYQSKMLKSPTSQLSNLKTSISSTVSQTTRNILSLGKMQRNQRIPNNPWYHLHKEIKLQD